VTSAIEVEIGARGDLAGANESCELLREFVGSAQGSSRAPQFR